MAKQRLIDANALKKLIQSKSNGMDDLWDTAGVLNAINCMPTIEPPKITQSSRDEKYIFNGECNHDELYDTREKYIFNGECDHSEHKEYPFESMGS